MERRPPIDRVHREAEQDEQTHRLDAPELGRGDHAAGGACDRALEQAGVRGDQRLGPFAAPGDGRRDQLVDVVEARPCGPGLDEQLGDA